MHQVQTNPKANLNEPDMRKNHPKWVEKNDFTISEKQLNEPDMDFIVRINGAIQPKLK